MTTVIKVENLSKLYRLGLIGGRTLADDLSRWMAKLRGKSDPLSIITEQDEDNVKNGYVSALHAVNLEVKQGQILGMIGRNGAGKSTLLKIISKITAPTKGSIKIKGRIGSLLEVGTGFHPELTGRENIFLNGAILGMTKRETSSKLDEIIEFADMAKFIDTPVKRYSSGMKVRLAFAVAAHLEPEIMIVDEVLAVGDAAFQKKCLGKMKEVASGGRTVLFVSHNMGMINSLCDEAILMSKGKLEFRGDTESTIEKYLSDTDGSSNINSGAPFYMDKKILDNQKFSQLRIQDIEIAAPGDNFSSIRTGGPLQIKIHYSSPVEYKTPAFVVRIKNYVGQELIRLSSMPISGYSIDKAFKDGEVVLTINELPLVAGSYYIDIGLVKERIEWLINLENVIKFDVQLYDVYESGFPLDTSRGIIVVNHSWAHEKL